MTPGLADAPHTVPPQKGFWEGRWGNVESSGVGVWVRVSILDLDLDLGEE